MTPASPTSTVAAAISALQPGLAPADEPEPVVKVPQEQLAQLGLDQGPTRGPANAPVTIVMFTDPACSFCGHAYGSIDQLLDEYPTKVKLVVKEFPIKAGSQLAAEAAYAADAQGKFWEMHDLMYAYEDDLSEPSLLALAHQAHLDVAAFTDALHSHRYASIVEADREAGGTIGVTGLPTFVINGQKVVGARPIAEMRAAIDAALAN